MMYSVNSLRRLFKPVNSSLILQNFIDHRQISCKLLKFGQLVVVEKKAENKAYLSTQIRILKTLVPIFEYLMTEIISQATYVYYALYYSTQLSQIGPIKILK